MKTLEDRLKSDRERQERYRQRQTAKGKRTISATISAEAYDALQAIKGQTQESNSAVVERLILAGIRSCAED